MILTTTPTIEGERIKSYLGIVEAVFDDVVDFDLDYSLEELLDDLKFKAEIKDADAVVGIQYNIHSLVKNDDGNMTAIMYAIGTAVKLF